MGYYSTSQICLNGHIITQSIEENRDRTENFCSLCGTSTISACPLCQAQIRGRYHDTSIIDDFGSYDPAPLYCHNCGKPYPWTASSLNAIRELIEFDEQLKEDEKQNLKETLPNLLVDTPQTKVAVVKFKAFMKKAGSATFDAVKSIITDIVSETIKKALFS